MKNKTPIFKKADIILAVILLVLGLCSLFLLRGGQGSELYVSVDGKEYGRYSLLKDQSFTVETPYGRNVVEISGGRACVIEADCPNHDCMNFAPVYRKGQSIMCLPHHLSIQVSGEEDGLDARTY